MKTLTQKITMQQLAEIAGISIATVSRVLNGSEKVSEGTKKKVLDLAKEYNFQPNETARTMAQGKSHMIAVVLPDIVNPYFSLLLQYLEELCEKNGYTMIFFNSNGDTEKEKSIVQKMIARQIDGLLITMTKVDSETIPLLKDVPFPVVVMTRAMKNLDSVGIDHIKGGALAADYLLQKNVEKFCYFGLEEDEKYWGFRDELLKNGISNDRIEIIGNQNWYFNSIENGAMILRNYIRNNIKNCKIGLFCVNDMYATHAVSEAQSNGIKIPDELSIVGFDNTMLCEICYPKLTSIFQPLDEIAKDSFEILMHRIEEKNLSSAPEVINLVPRIVVRGT